MRLLITLAVLGLTTAPAGPLAAQDRDGMRIYTPGQFNAVAITPSRLERSREEMNRDRNPASSSPSPAAVRERARTVVARAGLVCTVVDAGIVGRARQGEPLIEIDCAEGGGVIAVDSDPIQITNCLDLAPDTGQAGQRQRVVTSCQLPGNAGLVAQPAATGD
jgi:hypothetical protein